MSRRLTPWMLLAGWACTASAGPIAVRIDRDGAAVTLALEAREGVRINALLPPALELDNGQVVLFDGTRAEPHAPYFEAVPAPTARVPASTGRHTALLRASVCRRDETFCRTVEQSVHY